MACSTSPSAPGWMTSARVIATDAAPPRANDADDPLSPAGGAVGDELEEIAVRIEEVETVVIAPVDWRVMGNPALGEEAPRHLEIVPGDLERVMALAERVRDQRRIDRGGAGLPEQRAVAVAVAQQPLIVQPHLHAHPEHVGVEPLGAIEVRHVDAEVIEALHPHHAAPDATERQCRAISPSVAIQIRGVWRTWSMSSRRHASRDGRPMICGWNVKLVTPCTSVMPSNSVSQPWSTGPGGWIDRWPVNMKYGASS